MNFTQYIDADNLSTDFLDYLKKAFKGKKIKLTVETEPDATEYLMSSPANHERLLKSIKNVKKRDKLIHLDKQQLKKLIP
jgi:predicted glycosyltransferase involved in capsule biosynthesis